MTHRNNIIDLTPWLMLGPSLRPYPEGQLRVPSSLERLRLPGGYLETLRGFGQGAFNGSCRLVPPVHLQTIGERLGRIDGDFGERKRLEALWILAFDDVGTFWAFDGSIGKVLRIDRACFSDDEIPWDETFELCDLLTLWRRTVEKGFFVREGRIRLAADLAALSPHFEIPRLKAEVEKALEALEWEPLERIGIDAGFALSYALPQAHMKLGLQAHDPASTLASTNASLRVEWHGPESLHEICRLNAMFQDAGWLLDGDGPRTIIWDDGKTLPVEVQRALMTGCVRDRV